MLTDTNLKSKVDTLWEKLWSGGLSNPLDAIEQFSYLLFLKRLDDQENAREMRLAFAEIIWGYEHSASQQHESARQAEHLFQTLLHRAFRGEV